MASNAAIIVSLEPTKRKTQESCQQNQNSGYETNRTELG